MPLFREYLHTSSDNALQQHCQQCLTFGRFAGHEIQQATHAREVCTEPVAHLGHLDVRGACTQAAARLLGRDSLLCRVVFPGK